jgi:hypothetical protein
MDAVSTKAPKNLSYCGGGVLAGYLIFALLNFWLYGGFWANAGLALLLHGPVFIMYIALLLFLRRRWPQFLSRAALIVCGVAVGLFPVLGWFPVYYFRLDIAAIILGIQIASVVILASATYFVMRCSKRLHET